MFVFNSVTCVTIHLILAIFLTTTLLWPLRRGGKGMTLLCLRRLLFFVFSISFGQEVYPRKMRDKVRQQQLQIQMAQLYASEQVRIIRIPLDTVSYYCGVLWMCCRRHWLVVVLLFLYKIIMALLIPTISVDDLYHFVLSIIVIVKGWKHSKRNWDIFFQWRRSPGPSSCLSDLFKDWKKKTINPFC